MADVSRGTKRGFFVQPLAHRAGNGEKASTFTRVPFDALLRVESATTMTVFDCLSEESVTARRTVRGEYWSTVRTFLPFTNTATLPFRGPATYHIAKRRPFTEYSADAPVTVVVCRAPPCAAVDLVSAHAESTGAAATDTGCAKSGSARQATTTRKGDLRTRSRYRRPPPRCRHPKARTARALIALTPFDSSGSFHFSRSNRWPSSMLTVHAVS